MCVGVFVCIHHFVITMITMTESDHARNKMISDAQAQMKGLGIFVPKNAGKTPATLPKPKPNKSLNPTRASEYKNYKKHRRGFGYGQPQPKEPSVPRVYFPEEKQFTDRMWLTHKADRGYWQVNLPRKVGESAKYLGICGTEEEAIDMQDRKLEQLGMTYQQLINGLTPAHRRRYHSKLNHNARLRKNKANK